MPDTTQPEPPDIKVHLLVVEDEPLIRKLFVTLLKAAGYSVAEAEDGFAALTEIRRQRPALILSDLNMPRMTGFELLSVVRRRFPATRVIAMSGAFLGDQIPAGVAADAFYEKSGRPIGTLVQVIEDILKNRPDTPSFDSLDPHVALWVSRSGTPVPLSHILLSCSECLRSFPHAVEPEAAMHLTTTACVFCTAPVRYTLLDSAEQTHSGYAPTEPA